MNLAFIFVFQKNKAVISTYKGVFVIPCRKKKNNGGITVLQRRNRGMTISIHEIYRDAADRRISWQEALRMTVVIDDNGNIQQPATEHEKNILQQKVDALRPYAKSVDDPYLNKIVKIMHMYS